jgi:hypothetical protein
MNHIQLYLNDQLADLSDDSPIALTFQINNLAEVQNQQGNTSNQFKLPLTQNNRQILGFPDDITMATQTPYTALSARIIQNGIEILPNAIAEINQVDNDTASITILSGNVDFFDALGGQIADMGDSTSRWSNYGASLPWKPFDHEWNLQNASYSQLNTEKDGWIYPIIDYGLISLTDFTKPIDVRNLRPGFFVKKAVDLLVQSTGYTAKGSLLSDPLYPLLIAQFSNGSFDHGIDFQNQPDVKGILVKNTVSQTVSHPHTYDNMGYISWQDVVYDQSQWFHGINYTPTERISVEAIVTIPKLFFKGKPGTSDPDSLNIYIRVVDSNGYANLATATFDFNDGFDDYDHSTDGAGKVVWKTFYNTTFSIQTELSPDTRESLQIVYEFIGLTGQIFTIYPGASFQVKSVNDTVKFEETVQCERILPDMSQKDFLKDTFQRFGIICQTDVYSKTINFSSLKDIVANIPIAKDWTAKCVDQGKQINYKLGSYAQVNNMEYQTDPNILPLKFGWDSIIINDQTLNNVPSDMIVSKFGPSLNRPYIGGTIAQIAMIDATSDSTDFTISVQPRLLVDQKLKLNGNSITFIDGVHTPVVVNDYISTPYFYKPDGAYNLCWCDMESSISNQKLLGLKSKYYTDLQKILQNTKILVRYFLLAPRDIAELDLLIPVYLQQHNAYFYINKIDSWRKGQPCKVELVRLG